MSHLTRLGSGKYSDIFKVQNEDAEFVMKVSYYREESVKEFAKKKKEGDHRGAQKAKDEDAISISCTFSNIAEKMRNFKVTPHFIHVYESRDIKDFIEKVPILEKRFNELSPLQRKYNHVSFMELYDTDLTTFLSKEKFDDNTVKCIIFQVLYSIYAAQKLMKDWRHNDLSTNNVLIKRADIRNTSYSIDKTVFFTKMPYDIAIIDYDFVYADVNKLRNHRVTSGRFKLTGDRNASYDAHFFLKSVLKCITKNHNSKTNGTKKFLTSLSLQHNDRYDVEIPSLVPSEIIKHSYFNNLKANSDPVTKKYAIPE